MMNFFENSRIRKISLLGVARLANGWTSAEEICRVRAEAAYGDIWAPDPACYLTDREIAAD